MESYTFQKCTLKKLDRWFGLNRTFASQTLDQWLQTEVDLSELDRSMLQHLQGMLLKNAEAWNEQELALSCIGPLFSLVDFNAVYRFNLFSQRSIEAVLTGVHNDIKLSGEPDGIVATGYWEPEIPMFAFSEYKRLLDPNGDPVGQCLAAMLVGQELNEKPQPLYGCYVVGNSWRFLVLEEKGYTISQDYLATKDDIFDILRILKALKQIIMEMTANKEESGEPSL